jgi:hypothetical protein
VPVGESEVKVYCLAVAILLCGCHRPIDATWAVPNTCAPEAVGDPQWRTVQSPPGVRCRKYAKRYTCTFGHIGKRPVRAYFCVPWEK